MKALLSPETYEVARPLVIGGIEVLANTLRALGSPREFATVKDPADGVYRPGTTDVLPVPTVGEATIVPGRIQAAAGQAALAYVRTAIELALRGKLDALATAPINKAALQAAGVPFLDHTAMLRELAGSPNVLTMFSLGNLKIFFMARHMSMRDSLAEITAENIFQTLVKADTAMKTFGYPHARFGVAAINPHAGEGGLFGREEIEHIRPGIERARAAGVQAFGPVPADVVFHHTLQGRYDAALSLVHDQGHIAAKTLDFERTVAVTTGLPFVRTSVDHGTAYDIAGQGIASAVSMLESIKVAAEYARLIRTKSQQGS